MKFVLDTNILIYLLKNEDFGSFFKEKYQDNRQNELFYTFISVGELDSISIQNNWGKKKIQALNGVCKGFKLVSQVNRHVSKVYGKIDAYSQGKLKDISLPQGMSARNMGKNDLWIAAVAYVLEATLITADKDFEHLSPALIKLDYVDIQSFK
jgi:predicted nucleic acid-binding protein